MVGTDLLARNDQVSAANFKKQGSNEFKPLFSDGPTIHQSAPMWRTPVAAVVLDMGEASREQGFRLNGCR